MVLGMAMLLTVIGMGVVAVARVQTRTTTDSQDWLEAQMLAFSAAEHALTQLDTVDNWRTTLAGTNSGSLQRGTFTWSVVDLTDGDLGDDPEDPARLQATGTVNDASYTFSLDLTFTRMPLEAITKTISTTNLIHIKQNRSLRLTGAPLATNLNLEVNGILYGDVETKTTGGNGTIVGSVIEKAEPKEMPDPAVFDSYVAKATTIPCPPSNDALEGVVLSPQSNPWGTPNPDGVYYIYAAKNLTIRGVRIHGTLVIRCAEGKKVIFEDAVFLHNYRSDHPALLVDGDAQISLRSAEKELTESEWDMNFNPSGSGYEDQADEDKDDSYPNEISGLVHVKGNLLMDETARVRGAIIGEQTTVIDGDNEIVYSPVVAQTLIVGYTTYEAILGTWSRVVE